MNKIEILGDTTPHNMIEVKYDKAKKICLSIWDKPRSKQEFEDIFHDTIYRCLLTLGKQELSQEYMKSYFFKAFRINMIRRFGYAYNKYNSGKEIENVIIPVNSDYTNHIDGFGMLDLVEKRHGKEMRQMLWDNLNGITYQELNKLYNTNAYYELSKLKDELKKYYLDFQYNKIYHI